MSCFPSSDCWIVTVETDSYAGNFERDMTAFCTGLIGDCQVGEEEQAQFHADVEDYPFDDLGEYVPDDHGCFRPCSLGGDDAQSVLMFFCKKPTPYHLDLISSRVKVFGEEHNIKIENLTLSELKVKYFEMTHPWESDERT